MATSDEVIEHYDASGSTTGEWLRFSLIEETRDEHDELRRAHLDAVLRFERAYDELQHITHRLARFK